MARKEITYTATVGRDKGKVFLITEMAARPAHAWATRLLFAMLNAGVDLPDDVVSRGLAGLASIAFQAIGKVSVDVAEPLMDELLGCVQIVMEKGTRKWIDDDFEELVTIFQLQKEAFSLHVEPFTSGDLLTSA